MITPSKDWLIVARKYGYSFPDARMEAFVSELMSDIGAALATARRDAQPVAWNLIGNQDVFMATEFMPDSEHADEWRPLFTHAEPAEVQALRDNVTHWKANHEHMVERCSYLSQRADLPVDRIPAYEAHAKRTKDLEETVARYDGCIKVLERQLADGVAAQTGAGDAAIEDAAHHFERSGQHGVAAELRGLKCAPPESGTELVTKKGIENV